MGEELNQARKNCAENSVKIYDLGSSYELDTIHNNGTNT